MQIGKRRCPRIGTGNRCRSCISMEEVAKSMRSGARSSIPVPGPRFRGYRRTVVALPNSAEWPNRPGSDHSVSVRWATVADRPQTWRAA